ncbi:hypothetical protein EDB80DRAFT_690733 [Ilyonectria destructans]|nr:hypothetical protein EDB80DRAFT_690733 [Ilyonectria destructans]
MPFGRMDFGSYQASRDTWRHGKGQLQLARDDVHDGLDVASCESGGEECHELRDDCDSNSDSAFNSASESEDMETGEDSGEDTDEETDENTDSEEDEGMETDQQTSYDGSDFCLPSGYWLRLSEALFQLSDGTAATPHRTTAAYRALAEGDPPTVFMPHRTRSRGRINVAASLQQNNLVSLFN